jgi:hypothetical protein
LDNPQYSRQSTESYKNERRKRKNDPLTSAIANAG